MITMITTNGETLGDEINKLIMISGEWTMRVKVTNSIHLSTRFLSTATTTITTHHERKRNAFSFLSTYPSIHLSVFFSLVGIFSVAQYNWFGFHLRYPAGSWWEFSDLKLSDGRTDGWDTKYQKPVTMHIYLSVLLSSFLPSYHIIVKPNSLLKQLCPLSLSLCLFQSHIQKSCYSCSSSIFLLKNRYLSQTLHLVLGLQLTNPNST